ncbi:hypothetical protein A6A04_13745 [Paramagnetospirillum marisnigri]|uniref:Uncharacterized protein n=1 Tax=Paramagnetospirillum marisnigri TaxID=1285242 RepID=A0A178MUJ4_9PROT|nr:hypothetical protein [Paramagnetospirillum marisnigri]OAN53948.1 hypothetical protein A6A04_13745 [Paramagnetospirillum marisnigri]
MIEFLPLLQASVLLPVLWLLPGIALLILLLRIVARRLRSPLAETALDSLMAEARQQQPERAEAEIVGALRRDPALVEHAIAAVGRRHPTLPVFSGSWRFRMVLRHRLEMLERQCRGAHSPSRGVHSPSHGGLVAGLVLLGIGGPVLLGSGLFTAQSVWQGMANTDRSIEVFYAAFILFGGVATLAGGAFCLGGGWLLLRYRKAKRGEATPRS